MRNLMLRFGALSLLAATGCSQKVMTCEEGNEDLCDAGQPPADLCNSKEEALADARCILTLGKNIDPAFISFSGDEDWYSVTLPPNLTGRSLVHITGGYSAPATGVNFSINVLTEGGTMSLVRKIDRHGAAMPGVVDIIFPYDKSGTKLLFQVGDEAATSKPNFDARNPYTLMVEVKDNPDVNEPNDVTPTVLPLTQVGAELQGGMDGGALATEADVDKFTFTAPAGRKILYLKISAPALTPPPPYRLSYTLTDSANVPVSEGVVLNAFLAPDLATARLTKPGAYTLTIKGYQTPGSTTPIPGDLRLIYSVQVRIMDDLDMTEPNDTVAAPKVVTMALNSSQQFTGKLAYVPDPDVFGVDLQSSGSSAATLKYRLTVSPTAGRFPPLAPISDRQVRVVTQITGGTLQANQTACLTDPKVCPKSFGDDMGKQGLVEGLCKNNDPPQCVWSERDEKVTFRQLQNMEGIIPVPPHTGTLRYIVFVQDDGNNYADDRDYTIRFSYDADPDETMRFPLTNQTQTASLTESATVPNPPSAGEVQGSLTFGYGRTVDFDINKGEGIRAPDDYDAVPSDVDQYEFAFPGGLVTPLDRTWTLQWDLTNQVDGGGPPGQLALEIDFCNGLTGSTCNAITRTLAYSKGTLQPWYGNSLTSRANLWSSVSSGGTTTVTALPVGCFCMEPRFVSAGKFIVRVVAADRVSNERIDYKLRQGLAPYPQAYTGDGGVSVSCPSALVMGQMCNFTK